MRNPLAALPRLPGAPLPPTANLGGAAGIHFSGPGCQVDSEGGNLRRDARCPMAGGPGQEELEDEQALPPAPGEAHPASVLGKCSHGQKSRLLVKASYLHATPFKNRLHLKQKHVFRFVPILSLCFFLPALLLHQPSGAARPGGERRFVV